MRNLVLMLPMFLLAACDGALLGENINEKGSTSTASISAEQNRDNRKTLTISTEGLETMQGQHYEGWLVGGGQVVSTGRFNITQRNEVVEVNSDGEVLRIQGTGDYQYKISEELENSTVFVLTIEPNGDQDEGASNIHLVAGDIFNGQATATTDHGAALSVDFNSAAGSYILATPTNGPTTHDQGVWYLDPADETPTLELPTLPSGWAYEGWVVDTITGAVSSTGTFRSAGEADSDRAGGVKAGPLSQGPNVPGQDFINPGVKLNDGTHMLVISVEPSPDYDVRPFSIKPLRKLIPNASPITTLMPLDLFAVDGFPRLRITID